MGSIGKQNNGKEEREIYCFLFWLCQQRSCLSLCAMVSIKTSPYCPKSLFLLLEHSSLLNMTTTHHIFHLSLSIASSWLLLTQAILLPLLFEFSLFLSLDNRFFSIQWVVFRKTYSDFVLTYWNLIDEISEAPHCV